MNVAIDKLNPISQAAGAKFACAPDGFAQLIPMGEWPGEVEFGIQPEGVAGLEERDGRWVLPIVQVLDQAAVESCHATFAPDMLVDRDHASADPDQSTAAAGWGMESQLRPDGLYVRTRWSVDGLRDVEGGNFRYFSPVFPWEHLRLIEGNRYRPLQVHGYALTNVPCLRGIKAVCNSSRGVTTTVAAAGADANKAAASADERKRKMNEQLIQALGLAAGATEADVLAAVQALQQRVAAVESAQNDAAAECELKKLGPACKNRDVLKAALLKDRAGTLAIVGAIAAPEAPKALNRAGAKTPVVGTTEKGSTIANRQAALVNAVRNREKCGFQAAWDLARTEQPELFEEPKSETAAGQ